MLILGLNMFHADASAAIIQDGEVIFAIAEERLNRIKHYAGFPSLAIKACLDAAGAKMTDVDHVAVGQDSDANLSRKVQYALDPIQALFGNGKNYFAILNDGGRGVRMEHIEAENQHEGTCRSREFMKS